MLISFVRQLTSTLRQCTRYYPFQQPRASLLQRLPDVPVNFGPFEAKNGIKYTAYPCGQDYIVKNLFWLGDFEPWITSMIRCLVGEGEIICDIGAFIGDTALQTFSFVGSTGHIYCFEPVPNLQNCLSSNLEVNNVSCVTLVPAGLSNFSGHLNLSMPVGQPGQSTIISENSSRIECNDIEIEVTTFDDWLKESGVSTVAVCKIDVEDHEFEVLEGMKNSLDAGLIGSIIFERRKRCDVDDKVAQILYSYHYRVYRIYKSFLKLEAVDLQDGRNFLRGTDDYVAVLKDSVL